MCLSCFRSWTESKCFYSESKLTKTSCCQIDYTIVLYHRNLFQSNELRVIWFRQFFILFFGNFEPKLIHFGNRPGHHSSSFNCFSNSRLNLTSTCAKLRLTVLTRHITEKSAHDIFRDSSYFTFVSMTWFHSVVIMYSHGASDGMSTENTENSIPDIANIRVTHVHLNRLAYIVQCAGVVVFIFYRSFKCRDRWNKIGCKSCSRNWLYTVVYAECSNKFNSVTKV